MSDAAGEDAGNEQLNIQVRDQVRIGMKEGKGRLLVVVVVVFHRFFFSSKISSFLNFFFSSERRRGSFQSKEKYKDEKNHGSLCSTKGYPGNFSPFYA